MGVYFKHFPERNFMLSMFYGLVTNDDLESYITELLEEKYNTAGKVRLVIICNTTSASTLTYQSILSAGVRMQQAKFRHNGKLAIVANNRTNYGFARAYQIMADIRGSEEVKVLHNKDLNLAIEWVDADDLSLEIMAKIDELEQLGTI